MTFLGFCQSRFFSASFFLCEQDLLSNVLCNLNCDFFNLFVNSIYHEARKSWSNITFPEVGIYPLSYRLCKSLYSFQYFRWRNFLFCEIFLTYGTCRSRNCLFVYGRHCCRIHIVDINILQGQQRYFHTNLQFNLLDITIQVTGF